MHVLTFDLREAFRRLRFSRYLRCPHLIGSLSPRPQGDSSPAAPSPFERPLPRVNPLTATTRGSFSSMDSSGLDALLLCAAADAAASAKASAASVAVAQDRDYAAPAAAGDAANGTAEASDPNADSWIKVRLSWWCVGAP